MRSEYLIEYDLSDPYLNNGIVIVSRKDATSVKNFAELDGKTVGVQLSTKWFGEDMTSNIDTEVDVID